MNPREISLLNFVLEMHSAPSFSELQQSSGLPKATVHRCLSNLEQSRLLCRSEGRFYPGLLLLRWLHLSAARQNLWGGLLHPYLVQCSREFNEVAHVVHLVQRQGRTATYIDKVEGTGPIVLKSRIGRELDLYKTAAGQAILAQLSKTELEEYIHSMERHCSETQLTAFRRFPLERQLAETLARGYSLEVEQNEKNIQCAGVSLAAIQRNLALSLSTTTLVSLEQLCELGQRLSELTGQITQQLAENGND